MESSEIELDGHRIKSRVVNYTQQKDGVKMPHLHKQIIANPPAPVNLIRDNIDMVWETIGGYD